MSNMPESFKLSLIAEKDTAQKIADLLDHETSLPDCPTEATAVARFEIANNKWGVEAYFSDPPELKQIHTYLQPSVPILPNGNPVQGMLFIATVCCGKDFSFDDENLFQAFIHHSVIGIAAGETE